MFLGKVPKASWPMKSRRVISIAKPVGSRKTGTNAAPVFPTIRKNKSSSYFFLKKTFSFAGSDESAPVRVRLPGPVGRLPAGHGEKRGPVRVQEGDAKRQVMMMRTNVRRGRSNSLPDGLEPRSFTCCWTCCCSVGTCWAGKVTWRRSLRRNTAGSGGCL